MESIVYNKEGEKVSEIKLPQEVFGLSWNGDLVHQVVSSYRTNMRRPTSHAKDRSEVRGGGIKPWRQKGTGRARHGSIRSPIWVGGGVTHGPTKDKEYHSKINKKMKTKALFTVLSKKLKDKEIIFIDSLDFSSPQTKKAREVLSSISSKVEGFEDLLSKKNNSVYITLSEKDSNVQKSFNNLGNLHLEELRNINAFDILRFKYLMIVNPVKSLDFIKSKSEKLTNSRKNSNGKEKVAA